MNLSPASQSDLQQNVRQHLAQRGVIRVEDTGHYWSHYLREWVGGGHGNSMSRHDKIYTDWFMFTVFMDYRHYRRLTSARDHRINTRDTWLEDLCMGV